MPQFTENNETVAQSSNETMNFDEFVKANICRNIVAKICFHDIDDNADGYVTREELAEYYRRQEILGRELAETRNRLNFQIADKNSDGYISVEEIKDFGEKEMKVKTDNAFLGFFSATDKDKDNALNYTGCSLTYPFW
ncbi:unnamed protein product [Enterobius vermicularis]|uniref:EF-hand domain-containing protein n=1 Tax=Enterobius vermicularis TaxID=51028 RepID=A0A0N4VC87_ENTVE|nr:unnamed protein product [Enterobius vermicularis]